MSEWERSPGGGGDDGRPHINTGVGSTREILHTGTKGLLCTRVHTRMTQGSFTCALSSENAQNLRICMLTCRRRQERVHVGTA